MHAYTEDRAGMHIRDDALDHACAKVPFANSLVPRASEENLIPCLRVCVQLKTIDGICMGVRGRAARL